VWEGEREIHSKEIESVLECEREREENREGVERGKCRRVG
jgi:hypothetical protein